jgi:hypothetical protein
LRDTSVVPIADAGQPLRHDCDRLLGVHHRCCSQCEAVAMPP